MLDYRNETFMQVCERMNYRKAAEALGITQPAVTQQLHYLERQYGRKLLEYRNAHLYKTEAAQILEQYARAMPIASKRFCRSASG